MKLFEQLATELSGSIQSGVLRPGDRMPSVRELAHARSVSVGTVLQAYGVLEDQGAIEARPRSGYFVAARTPARLSTPGTHAPDGRSKPVEVSELVFHILEATRDRAVVPFGSAFVSPSSFPFQQLSRAFAAASRSLDPWSTVADLPTGNVELRRLIARRYLEAGCTLRPDEVIITSGAMEALNLCVQVVTRPGDMIAIESPAFYAALQAIEALGLRAVEIPTSPRDGVDLAALEQALKRHPIKACWFMPTFQNPLGCVMPEANKRRLVELLTRHDVPLIEDDVYAELSLSGVRPKPAKAFDTAGLVMHCSSFSKSLAPGFRVGWVAPGRYARRIEHRKVATTLSASIPSQLAIVEYLKHGGYERHLRQLRHSLRVQQRELVASIARHFPAGSQVTYPDGGYFVWVELPADVDALDVHRRALQAGISVSPGPMFSAVRGFRSCLRLNYGHPWSTQMEDAVAALGRIIAHAREGARS